MPRFIGTACFLLVLCAVVARADGGEPAVADSLLAASADTTLAGKQREALVRQAIRHDSSGRAMHALAPWVAYGASPEGYLFCGERMTLDPGVYYLAAEAEDRATKTVGTLHDSLRVRRFGAEALDLEDMSPGGRVFRVVVDDLQSAQQATASEAFRVVW